MKEVNTVESKEEVRKYMKVEGETLLRNIKSSFSH